MKKILFSIILSFILILPSFSAIDGILSMELMNAKQENNQEKVHEIAKKLIVKSPDDPLGYEEEANYWFEKENYSNAIYFYSSVIEKSKNIKEHDKNLLEKQGYNKSQIEKLLSPKLYASYNNKIGYAYLGRGVSYFCLKEYDKAFPDFNSAENYITNFYIPLYKGFIYFLDKKNYTLALKEANLAKKLAKNETDLNRANRLIDMIKKQQNKIKE